MKKLMCVINQPPYANSHVLELLETAMVAAVFDMQVSLLFCGEGLWNLLQKQNADPLGQRTVSKVLLAMPDYDVSAIYVCADTLQDKQIDTDEFVLPVTFLNKAAQADLMSEQDAVMGTGT
ncbi:MAG: DsrE family protein [Pseudomonadaceae bacterium]|nr:DsrE family protein [Pseudomonadaceae bacterium]